MKKQKKRGEKTAIWKKGEIGYLVCPYCDNVLMFTDKELAIVLKQWKKQKKVGTK